MSREFLIRLEDRRDEDDMHARLKHALRASAAFVSESSDHIALKGPTSQSDWAFDIRIFFSSPTLLEISSWNESMQAELQPILRSVLAQTPHVVLDEDLEPAQLY